ncbi:hypothetical protein BZL30_9192 [Mycobacterium kansasii]|uniref:Uncharacterized protein n=1 Tax=Mycobacterium kansasii TaxID=1768 RepID=A0A1V3WB64_MYCKA|nr:hypothetical protein BZL30_9192 [Mycobacterium kansasii]
MRDRLAFGFGYRHDAGAARGLWSCRRWVQSPGYFQDLWIGEFRRPPIRRFGATVTYVAPPCGKRSS